MYRYTVPLETMTFKSSDREKIVQTFKKMRVERVMLCGSSYFYDQKRKAAFLEALTDDCAYLKAAGFEVGAWKWTFMDLRKDTEFVRMRLPSGADSRQSVCPSDPNFRKFAADFICDLAGCGVDLIMLDDDFRYGNLDSSVGCLCDNHIAYMSELLGEALTLDMLRDKLFAGGANKYRTAWLKAKRHFFALFSSDMRAALDKVAPHVRLGLCSSYCSWDMDGMTPYEIAKILAGNTAPFLRLSGAPFWAARSAPDGHTLEETIEFARLQLSFREANDGIEVFAEDDSWPRPRSKCPAGYIEGFDQAIRASGGIDGMLKYTMTYSSSERYETGYNDRHIRNLPVYDSIDTMFGNKSCTGIRVFEYREKYENADLPTHFASERELEFAFSFSYASRMLAAANIPTVYTDVGTVGIAFGENAKYIPTSALKNGLILDARAAEILTARGIDVGLGSKGERKCVITESFADCREHVAVSGAYAYDLTLKQGARVESTFTTYDFDGQTLALLPHAEVQFDDHSEIVGSYTYENKSGEKFLVFAFDGQCAGEMLFRSYARADQLKRIIPRLGRGCGFTLCTSPHLYVIAKQSGDRVTLGLWNFSVDPIEEPYFRLDATADVRILSTVATDATVSGDTVALSRIEPFGFAAVEYEITH